MRHMQRSTLARLGFMALILIFVASACSLGGGDDDTGADAQPTVPATITPPFTKTPIPSFTPFLTSTPIPGFQQVPTATRIGVLPTQPVVFTPFPTWTPALASATPYPYDVRISYPVDGSQIAGFVTVIGSASHPRFLQYALEWGPDPNPGNLWYPITSPQTYPIVSGALGAVNTNAASDGVYQIRLHIWLNDGTETFDYATGIRVSNTAPTAVPTPTNTPRPNRAPVIQPIPSQQVDAGSTITIPVTTSDPDGDFVNIFSASSNNAIATVQVASPTQISVTGVTAGIATVTVTANDNNGGLTSTAFIVTVSGQNQAPTISPILNQIVDVGQTFSLPVSASDPDGDALTLTVTSSDTGIVTATVPDASTVSLTGVAVGTATVTVTARDGKGGAVNTTFQVEAGQPNRSPVIDAIPAQTMSVGDTLDVFYVASDPDGDQIVADVVSDTLGVAVATLTAPGTIQLQAVGAGTATVTLTVSDNIPNPASATFQVTVAQGNLPPTVDSIGPQTMSVGELKDMPYNASDPDGDALTPSVLSDNVGVVSAAINTPGFVTLNAVGAGTATVTLTVEDGNNPAVSTTFTVSVASVNLPPNVVAIGQQTLGVGDLVDVLYSASDPDGDALTPFVVSDNLGVVSAAINTPGFITLNAVGAGSATVTLTIEDGNNPAVSVPFTVTVTQNTPPTVDLILDQTMSVGDLLDVGYSAFDAEDPIDAFASSDNTGVVTAAVNTPGLITLNAVGPGVATVTLTISDNVNTPVSTSFVVNVAAVNQNPIVQPVAQQVVDVGATVNVPVIASDPDGDPVTLGASSDNPGIATAFENGVAQVDVTGVAPGQANVYVEVSDGKGGLAGTSFVVIVQGVNQNPIIQPIAQQTVNVGDTISVPVITSDPDGDPVTLGASSDNPGIATAFENGVAQVDVTGVAPGQANVYVEVSDGKGGLAGTNFVVIVQGVNNPPVIQPIGDQSVAVGDQLSVAVVITDADGNAVVVTALSQNLGVAVAEAIGTDTILLTGVSEGAVMIDVTADDAQGGITNAAFTVTVAAAVPSFDLMQYPVIPAISQPMAQTLGQLYQSGVSNFGNQAGAFSKVGGNTLDNPSFLAPFNDPNQFNLGSFGSLSTTIDFYKITQVRPTVDPLINSFNVDSAAVGAQDFGIDLFTGNVMPDPLCQGIGASSPLACEYMLTKPSIALISFNAANAIYMDPAVFRSELQSIIQQTLQNHGVIPVLATIPADSVATSEQLLPYNQAIVEVAEQSGIAGIPLWNLWRAMQEGGVADPTSVAPSGAGDLTALNYGYNIRNLTALQVLETVRAAAGIN